VKKLTTEQINERVDRLTELINKEDRTQEEDQLIEKLQIELSRHMQLPDELTVFRERFGSTDSSKPFG
jgi:hypothetical protein